MSLKEFEIVFRAHAVNCIVSVLLSYPRLKADTGFGSQVEKSAVCSVEQVQPSSTILTP